MCSSLITCENLKTPPSVNHIGSETLSLESLSVTSVILGLRDISDTLSLEAHCRRCDLGCTWLSVSLTCPLHITVLNLLILAEEPAPAGLEPLQELVVHGTNLGLLQDEG
jgi:hypothetical protein